MQVETAILAHQIVDQPDGRVDLIGLIDGVRAPHLPVTVNPMILYAVFRAESGDIGEHAARLEMTDSAGTTLLTTPPLPFTIHQMWEEVYDQLPIVFQIPRLTYNQPAHYRFHIVMDDRVLHTLRYHVVMDEAGPPAPE